MEADEPAGSKAMKQGSRACWMQSKETEFEEVCSEVRGLSVLKGQ